MMEVPALPVQASPPCMPKMASRMARHRDSIWSERGRFVNRVGFDWGGRNVLGTWVSIQ
jgi:hypothetical protein